MFFVSFKSFSTWDGLKTLSRPTLGVRIFLKTTLKFVYIGGVRNGIFAVQNNMPACFISVAPMSDASSLYVNNFSPVVEPKFVHDYAVELSGDYSDSHKVVFSTNMV